MTSTARPVLAFAGTPNEAAEVLGALNDAGYQIDLVVTAPDRRRGRGKATTPTPVKAKATELGLGVSHDLADLADSAAELMVVVAYGYIIGAESLALMPMVNLHFSLLPRWRGAAPVERAILAGDEMTGVCVMEVAAGLDTGDVYGRSETPIGRKTALELRAELVAKGSDLLIEVLDLGIEVGLGSPEPQSGDPTYAHKLDSSDRFIDWSLPPEQTDRIVRIGDAWTTVGGRRLKIHEVTADRADDDAFWVSCGDSELGLITVQPEGKKPMPAHQWALGARIQQNEKLEP